MVRIGMMEEGEAPVITKAEKFGIYNDHNDFLFTPFSDVPLWA